VRTRSWPYLEVVALQLARTQVNLIRECRELGKPHQEPKQRAGELLAAYVFEVRHLHCACIGARKNVTRAPSWCDMIMLYLQWITAPTA